MKKLTLSIIGIVCATCMVEAQKQDSNQPDQQIIVNKEFDEDGNLIGYDSTYIHSWPGDSTFHFDFDDELIFGSRFPNMDELLKEFLGDSLNSGFSRNFKFSPFDDEEFFNNFMHSFSDSVFIEKFKFDNDSLPHFRHDFVFPDMKELQEQLKNFDFPDNLIPQDLNEEQKKELDEMLKKHQKELEELKKKWKKL